MFLLGEFAGTIKIFPQTLGNGFNSGSVQFRTQPEFHTP